MIDNPFVMVVLIVLITAVAGTLRAKYKAQHGIIEVGKHQDRLAQDPDAARLREEIKTLKDRVAVLERIATDSSNRLDQEIEALRDRD